MTQERWRTDRNREHMRVYDAYAHATTVIDEAHRLNHDGMMFHASGKVEGMVDANVDEFLLVTSAYNFPHIQRMAFTFGRGDIDIAVYEDTVTAAHGVAIDVENTNRNSSNTNQLLAYSGPTLTDDGNLIHTQWVAPTSTGVGQSPTGITTNSNGEEWILKPSTKYLIRLTNNSGGAIALAGEALWYEPSYVVDETN